MRSAPQSTAVRTAVISTETLNLLVGTALDRRWPEGAEALDTICRYALMPGGKLFRPLLLLESTLAVGGQVDWVLPAAVGAECGHVASLIHDDIIDKDDLRRGRPSVHSKFGVADAIVAGDALIFDMFAGLADCRTAGVPDDRVVGALKAVARAGLDLCRGQSLEAVICEGLIFDEERYITMARLKTAAFFRGACESGAVLGGGSDEAVAALARFGDHLGIAFQIHDDLLAYTSDTQTTGKAGTSDVVNGRLTLPVILAFHAADPLQRSRLVEALGGTSDPGVALATVHEILEGAGAVTAAASVARRYATGARDALLLLPPTPSRERLTWLAELVIARDH